MEECSLERGEVMYSLTVSLVTSPSICLSQVMSTATYPLVVLTRVNQITHSIYKYSNYSGSRMWWFPQTDRVVISIATGHGASSLLIIDLSQDLSSFVHYTLIWSFYSWLFCIDRQTLVLSAVGVRDLMNDYDFCSNRNNFS